MDKVAYIIPGYPHSGREKPYRRIAEFFRFRGIKPIIISMLWKRATLSNNLEQFMRAHQKFGGGEAYVLGFSVGAVIALIASTKVKIKTAILCSLSPAFKEDVQLWKKSWKKFVGKKRLEDYKMCSFDQLVKRVNCRTVLVAGGKEYPLLLRRVKMAKKKLKNSELVIIPGAKHDISQKEYLEVLRKIVDNI
ncbi:hypothetical protein HYV85_00780 [Candidatus Woesearchaeota archaeon]|nr:hypothetical protein [Candidatus Woesearchaeota archaeon]